MGFVLNADPMAQPEVWEWDPIFGGKSHKPVAFAEPWISVLPSTAALHPAEEASPLPAGFSSSVLILLSC